MSKLSTLAAGLAVAPVLVFAMPVFADSPGDLAGGADIYQVRNVTTNGAYGASATATCDEVVKYSVKLSNTDFGTVSNITVKAPLTGEMTASGTNANGDTTSTSGTVTVTASKGTLNYVSGSTQLYTVDGQLIKGLPDGVTTGGVNAGDLKGSTREFLQFQAKVKCETPTTPETPKTPTTPAKPTPTTPTELPHTGAGSAAIVVAGAAAFAGVAHRAFSFRRQGR